jgi:hypothetical protein
MVSLQHLEEDRLHLENITMRENADAQAALTDRMG